MRLKCPNLSCVTELNSKVQSKINRDGFYFRPSDGRKIQRLKCKACGKRFSYATHSPAYRQNKRRINFKLQELFVSGISQRRAARLLRVSRKTIERKLLFLGAQAKLKHERFTKNYNKVNSFQFDDLQTIEHTKCKPVSVTMAVETQSRKILGFEVSRMPATGHLAAISKKKYGFRKDERRKGIEKLFQKINPLVDKDALIVSDEHPFYAPKVREYFPTCMYKQFKGAKGSVSAQGELKKQYYDPLFSINHTFAMLRANINRLFRRSWCTSKIPDRLKDHIYIYVNYHNEVLTR